MSTPSLKCVNWTRKEDEVLCVAYMKVSENSTKGNGQKGDGIWKQVERKLIDGFNGNPPNARSDESCKSRWQKFLFPYMNKWHSCVTRSEGRLHSGANHIDQQHLADDMFRQDMKGKSFNFHSCYDLCKDWVTFDTPLQEHFGPPPVQRNHTVSLEDDDDPVDSSSTPTLSRDPIPRPMGRNAARRKQIKDQEKEKKAFEDKLLARMDRLAEDNAKAEEAKAIREKMKEDRRERDREEAILMMQTVNFTPKSKAYFDGKKREALEKLSARELFPNTGSTSNDYHPQIPFDEDEYR